MNLHWGKTLEHKWVKIKHRPQNYTIYNHYNYTEYKLTAHKYHWNDVVINNNKTGNQSALYAENQFLKKSKIMTDLMAHGVRSQSFTTVVVIASIFLFLTMTITAAVVVFCRKRNTVFAFQKSEQEADIDYELDDMNTDVEYTETEFESETDSMKPRKSLSHTGVGIESDFENSPARRPLVPNLQHESEIEDSPVHHTCRCGADPRGQYQRMVVTAVLEKPNRPPNLHHLSTDEDMHPEARTHYLQRINRRYYYHGFGGITSDMESDHEACSISKPPIINITYADDPPAYESLDYLPPGNQHVVTVDIEKYGHQFPTLPSENMSQVDVHYSNFSCHNTNNTEVNCEKTFDNNEAAVVYVELPPKEKLPLENSAVGFVDLPPKPGMTENSVLSTPSTPTTPLAPPSTPIGGVMGVGIAMMGVVSVGCEQDMDLPPFVPTDAVINDHTAMTGISECCPCTVDCGDTKQACSYQTKPG